MKLSKRHKRFPHDTFDGDPDGVRYKMLRGFHKPQRKHVKQEIPPRVKEKV